MSGIALTCLAPSTRSSRLCRVGPPSSVHPDPASLVALGALLPAQSPDTCCLRDAIVQIAARPAVLAPPMLQQLPQGRAPGASSARLGCLSFGTCQAAQAGPAIEPGPGLFVVTCAAQSAASRVPHAPLVLVWPSITRCRGQLTTHWENGYRRTLPVDTRLCTRTASTCSRIGLPSGRLMLMG